AAAFQQRTAAAAGLKVGLAWAGNPSHQNDRNRSLALSALAPLFAVKGISFFGLQKDGRAGEIASAGLAERVVDLSSDLAAFADTAAAIASLDLVISVDTAVAHLAGGLAKPVWLLLPFVPDWRWLLGREDSPWYPAMRLYRQPARGDWQSVVERVARDLSTASCASPNLIRRSDSASRMLGTSPAITEARRGDRESNAITAGAAETFAEALRQQRAGRVQEAAALYKRVLATEPSHVEAHYNLGTALQALGRLDEAITSHRRALAIRPCYAEAHNNVGVALQAQGRLEQALESYQRALSCKPDFVRAHNNAGNALKELGRLEEAVASYRRALTFSPDFAAAH